MKKNIFTLIELLIVVAIIAILAGMLLPALNSAREKARSISCLSRIKQVNLEMNMYADSHDDRLPARGESRGEHIGFWYQRLDLKKEDNSQKDLVYCPTPTLEPKTHTVYKLAQTFGLNIWMTGETNFANARHAFPKRGRIVKPERKDFVANTTSGVVLFGDSIYQQQATGDFGGAPIQYVGIDVKYNTPYFDGAVHFRHSGDTANFGMLDGSAASMNFTSAYNRSCITAGYMQNLTFVQKQLQ